jgi:hypothetical protein
MVGVSATQLNYPDTLQLLRFSIACGTATTIEDQRVDELRDLVAPISQFSFNATSSGNRVPTPNPFGTTFTCAALQSNNFTKSDWSTFSRRLLIDADPSTQLITIGGRSLARSVPATQVTMTSIFRPDFAQSFSLAPSAAAAVANSRSPAPVAALNFAAQNNITGKVSTEQLGRASSFFQNISSLISNIGGVNASTLNGLTDIGALNGTLGASGLGSVLAGFTGYVESTTNATILVGKDPKTSGVVTSVEKRVFPSVTPKPSNAGAVAAAIGGAVGGILGLILLIVTVAVISKRMRVSRAKKAFAEGPAGNRKSELVFTDKPSGFKGASIPQTTDGSEQDPIAFSPKPLKLSMSMRLGTPAKNRLHQIIDIGASAMPPPPGFLPEQQVVTSAVPYPPLPKHHFGTGRSLRGVATINPAAAIKVRATMLRTLDPSAPKAVMPVDATAFPEVAEEVIQKKKLKRMMSVAMKGAGDEEDSAIMLNPLAYGDLKPAAAGASGAGKMESPIQRRNSIDRTQAVFVQQQVRGAIKSSVRKAQRDRGTPAQNKRLTLKGKEILGEGFDPAMLNMSLPHAFTSATPLKSTGSFLVQQQGAASTQKKSAMNGLFG